LTRSRSVWDFAEHRRRLVFAVAVDGQAAFLAISTLLSYLLIYTPLKRKTPLCTLLGSFPGAMPVLIGWAGASAGIDRHAWFLFAILFLWQFPHFLAIALMYREDYALTGYKMLPKFDLDSRFTRAEIVAFTVILIVTTMLPPVDHAGPIYLTDMFLAGVFFLITSQNWLDQLRKSWPAAWCMPPLSICLWFLRRSSRGRLEVPLWREPIRSNPGVPLTTHWEPRYSAVY